MKYLILVFLFHKENFVICSTYEIHVSEVYARPGLVYSKNSLVAKRQAV